jgi:hypothetical protein
MIFSSYKSDVHPAGGWSAQNVGAVVYRPSMSKLSFCDESLTLSQEEIAALEARPDPAHGLEPVLDCELEAHHHGPHLALGQAYGAEAEVWLQWLPGERRELVEKRDYCEAEEPDPRDPDDPWTCELPAGHPGAHSFDLR